MTGPVFIDNRDGNTFAKSIREHLRALRKAGQSPDELCIATGYFNAAGWLLVATEAERLGKIRLLLGVEPTPSTEMRPREPGDPREPERTKQQVKAAFQNQVEGLKQERDHGFPFRADGIGRLRRLVEFFHSERVEVRRYENRFFHAKAWLLRGTHRGVLAGSSNLTAGGMTGNLELNLGHYEDPLLDQVDQWYDAVWDDAAPFDLAALYEDLFQEVAPWLIYLRVLWELYGKEIEAEQEELGSLALTRFQQHGVWRARRLLNELGGVIVADGVGLGKTFVAGGLMETYRDRRQRILLIRPAALKGTWDRFLSDNYLGDVESVSYERLASDINFLGDRHHLERPLSDYQLVVIDEAHNYRNPDAPTRAGVLRQFLRGPRRDLVLLTATPVNNSLYDLYHLLSFFLKQDARLLNKGILSIKGVFENATQLNPADLHPDLLYPIVDATTVKRTRQFVKKHYPDDRIPGPDGRLMPITFPKPITTTVRYDLDEVLPGFFAQFAEALMPEEGDPRLTMARYQVDRYLLAPSEEVRREGSVVGLLRAGLLKRFESSAHAFANTCFKMALQHQRFLQAMDEGHVLRQEFNKKEYGATEDLDEAEWIDYLEKSDNTDPLALYDSARLRADVTNDLALLTEFAEKARTVRPNADPKLRALVQELSAIVAQAKQDSTTEQETRTNRKVMVFSYFKDTALWIREWLNGQVEHHKELACYRNRLATTCGSPDHAAILDSDEASWGFAPESAAPENYQGGDRFDLLITTDVLAEGVNLQQCRNIINYDLPWNPMRLVQRHGRIDRLLSPHKRVFQRTFFPDAHLDELLKLEIRVRRKLMLAAASVGVPQTPIEEGATGAQIFTESRKEIEQIANETTEIFEKGGTAAAAQTGEEYRQELRKALSGDLRHNIADLPRMSGSGMVRGNRSGHFFCATIGPRVYLRFVPDDAQPDGNLIEELGTCLRLIECDETTPRIAPDMERAYHAWELACAHIWKAWDFFTDSANLQPKVRKLNREVDEFLSENPALDVDQAKLDRISDILLSPWPLREENKLREVWKEEHPSDQNKALALIKAIEKTGLEPFEQPARFHKIEKDEVRLICWLRIQAES